MRIESSLKFLIILIYNKITAVLEDKSKSVML